HRGGDCEQASRKEEVSGGLCTTCCHRSDRRHTACVRAALKKAKEQHKDVYSGEANKLQEPFIQHGKGSAAAYKDVESNRIVQNGSIRMVLLSTFVAVCGSFSLGTCVGYSAPTQAAIRGDLNLSVAEFSMLGSLVTIGAMLGAITSGRITDFIGRKGTMRMSIGFCITGWLAVFSSKDPHSLDMGRFFTGYGIGIISFVVPVYIAEIAPKNLRGGLATANQAKVGFQKEFQVALRRLRVKDVDISQEADEILDYIETLRSLPKTTFLDWLKSKHVRSVVIYIASFSIGMGPVPWVIMSEMFPIHVKGSAGSLVVLVNWLGAWVVSYTFNFLISWSSPG
ncbi:Sugar transporter ERD6-like 16, partial [Mucuna pruriens]